MDFKISSAFLGSFQKSGDVVSSSFSLMSSFFLSTSKIPPQGFQPLTDIFMHFRGYHGHDFLLVGCKDSDNSYEFCLPEKMHSFIRAGVVSWEENYGMSGSIATQP
jgi:hypothetical protein